MTVRTRFAPSPTGMLNIGGARTALFNWLYARHHGGQFILRIEDTDEVRSTEDSVSAIIDSMRWLGLDWDEGPVGLDGDKGSCGPYYQMKRLDIYREHLERLVEEGKAYPCYCSKEELGEMRRLAQLEKKSPGYDGRCRRLTDRQKADYEKGGRSPVLRFMMPDEGVTVVDDSIRGHVSFENSLLQDLVIRKAAGGPTYNFACVVDDHLMGMTDVIRGDDHLSNTPAQTQLYLALGWTPPKFAHLSMILGSDGAKLSKRHGATSVLEYKTLGYLPQVMRNYLALLGWSNTESQQLFAGDELVKAFDLAGCQKGPATFDAAKLVWMNGEYLRKLAPEALMREAEPFLKEAGLLGLAGPPLERVVAMEQEKYKLLTDVPARVDFFYEEVTFDPKAKKNVLESPGVKAILLGLVEMLRVLDEFTEKSLEERIRAFCAEKGLKPKQVFHPIRVSCTGRTDGPTLFLMLELLGQGEVVSRLEAAASALSE